MTLHTLDHFSASDNARYMFPKGNEIPYYMDFRVHVGVPSDRIFYYSNEFVGERVVLVADGFGVSGNYGNGSIFVSRDHLPKTIDELIEAANKGL